MKTAAPTQAKTVPSASQSADGYLFVSLSGGAVVLFCTKRKTHAEAMTRTIQSIMSTAPLIGACRRRTPHNLSTVVPSFVANCPKSSVNSFTVYSSFERLNKYITIKSRRREFTPSHPWHVHRPAPYFYVSPNKC